MEKTEEFALHNDCISAFNRELYSDVFTVENIVSKKVAVKIGTQKFYGFFLEKGTESFFSLAEHVKELPFRVLDGSEDDYKGNVFFTITDIEPITIPAEKKLSFRELMNMISRFKHTNKTHQLLYNIAAVSGFIDRVNYRVSTDAGFGKDSTISIIQQLVDSTVNLYGATFAKLEYVLLNKLIVLNELGNLKKDEKMDMQEFLLATGAYFNTYTKRSRKTNTTQEEYDISRLSLILLYNLPSYYTGKAQEYFDQMFTKAVINRFIPFVFEGRLTTAFENLIDPDIILEENRENYKDIIATLNYFKQQPLKTIKYEVDRMVIKFSDELKRYERTFNILLKYVAEYSESQEEFDKLSKELYNCYLSYNKLLVDEKPKEEKLK